jgi:hypothetical protein
MAAQDVIRWNFGLAMAFILLILCYVAKLKYDSTLTPSGVQSLKADEGKNLITLLLTINVVTVLYWRWWPSPYQVGPPAR